VIKVGRGLYYPVSLDSIDESKSQSKTHGRVGDIRQLPLTLQVAPAIRTFS